MKALLLAAVRWLAGEEPARASRRGVVLGACFSLLTLAYALTSAWRVVAPLAGGVQPAVPADQGDARFGVSLAVRKEIFRELADAEPEARRESSRRFAGPGLEWSAEDDRASHERRKVAELATRYALSITQVYLILDEGIRARWLGSNGEPLEPRTVPLNPRRKYGW
jgi:hypothetical protein